MKSNKDNSNIYILKLALILVLILILGLLFLYCWVSYYNKLLRFPYILKGNIFLMIVYMILTYIFMLIFDCNNINENRPVALAFSELISIIFCNTVAYLTIIIPAAAVGFMPILPIVLLSIYDFFAIVIWSLVSHSILNKLFPAKELLLISSNSTVENIVYKFSNRNDLYKIVETIDIDNYSLGDVYHKCSLYDNILIGDITSEVRNDIIKHCFNNSRNIYVVPKISDILIKYSEEILLFDTPIYLSSNFRISLEREFFKRLIDIILSLIIILLFLPVWIVFAIIIKCEDGGPIFFTQDRVTKNKKIFKIYKFRSMKVSNSIEVLPTLNDDERITKIGKFMRRFHVDEIPQFLNVLIGDMSIVGPRPERIEHVELYTKEVSEFEYRSKVKAGITGLAQIYGKYNTNAIDKLKLDLIYIKNSSLIFDLELILRTIKILFTKDSIDGFDERTQEYIKEKTK